MVAELIFGAVSLLFVLAVCDLYLGEGRRLLTARGERVLGPALHRVGPALRWLMVRSRPCRALAVRLALRAVRLAGAAWRRGDRRVRTAWGALVEARARRQAAGTATAPARSRDVRVIGAGPLRGRGAGRAGAGRPRSARPRLRVRSDSTRSGDGRSERPEHGPRRDRASRTARTRRAAVG